MLILVLSALTAKSATTSVTIGGLTYLVDLDASECSVTKCESSATEIEIPSSITYDGKTYPVTSIGEGAFKLRSSLTIVTIPASVTTIGKNAFLGATGIKSVFITDLAAWCNITFENRYASPLFNSDGYEGIDLFLNGEKVVNLNIPEGVSKIMDFAFPRCKSITSVTIPNTVTSIGSYAFYKCTSITNIFIPNSVTSIGNEAFEYCKSLTSITIPNSVTSIGGFAFADCESLTDVTIPSSLTSIGGEAFWNCKQLKSVFITDLEAWCNIKFGPAFANPLCPFSGTEVDLFLNGEKVVDLTIPKGITNIGYDQFIGCNSIERVTIPEGVETIGISAFEGCKHLSEVHLPSTVKELGQLCFAKSRNHMSVHCAALIPPIIKYDEDKKNSTHSFYQTIGRHYLYVPRGTKEAYEKADIWQDKFTISEEDFPATLNLTVDNAAAVTATFPATDRTLELHNGLNEVTFTPEQEKTIKLTPTGKKLYQVKKGDEVLPSSDSYTIDIADGDNITVEANYPDIDYTVTFDISGFGAENFITAVDVDGTPVENFLAPFTVKNGSELTISGDTDKYEVTSYKINGETATFSSPTTILVTDNVTFTLEVRQFACFPVTVNIDDPSRVTLYNGEYSSKEAVELVAGDNTVTVSRNAPRMALVANDGSYIVSVAYPDKDLPVDDLKKAVIDLNPLHDNDVIAIRTAVIVRDRHAAIYLSGMAEGAEHLTFTRANASTPVAELTDGYHLFDFFDRDNPFRIGTGGPVESHVYLNDEALDEETTGNYTVDLENDDVLKVFFGEAPATYNVTIDRVDMEVMDAQPAIIANAKVTRDEIREVPLTGSTTTFTALAGTSLRIVPDEGTVLVHGNEETGEAYTTTVNSDLFFELQHALSAIDGIGADGNATETGRFAPDGRRLGAPARGINIIRMSDDTTRKTVVR